MGLACFATEAYAVARGHRSRPGKVLSRAFVRYVLLPGLVCVVSLWGADKSIGMLGQLALTLAIVIPLGPLTYLLVYQPLANAAVLVLLIVSVGVHFALVGLGLAIFGAEGQRTAAFTDARFDIGSLAISGQSIVEVLVSVVLIGLLYLYFERSLSSKALRATAVNRLGARLVGIGTTQARQPGLHAGGRHGHAVRHPDRPQWLRGRDHRWAGELSAGRRRRAARGSARALRLVLGQRLQGGNCAHADYPRVAVAFADQHPRRRRIRGEA